jgi:hypothetical protein
VVLSVTQAKGERLTVRVVDLPRGPSASSSVPPRTTLELLVDGDAAQQGHPGSTQITEPLSYNCLHALRKWKAERDAPSKRSRPGVATGLGGYPLDDLA